MMLSILQDSYGSEPERVLSVGESEVPSIGDDEILVRVHAASIDRGTWHIMAGLPYPIRVAGFGLRAPKYSNPGRSLAGTVETVGGATAGFRPGDEVFGVGYGSLAEYAVVPAGKLAARPGNLTFEEAATVPVSGLTALQAVRDHGQVTDGQRVLIIGASGGVGTFAVQIAKASEAEVTGVASPAKLDTVRALGADHVLDYTVDDVTNPEHRYDVILDIGGNRRLADLRAALARRGRLIIVGGETDGRWLGGSSRQIRAMMLSPFVAAKLGTFLASENAKDLDELRELIETGIVTPVLDRSYPLADAPAAIRHLIDGHARGKLAVTV